MHNHSALGAELALVGQYYILPTNFASITCDLHQALLGACFGKHTEFKVEREGKSVHLMFF